MKRNLFVIFGGGDLTWRKLIPSIFDLLYDHNVDAPYEIIIVDKLPLSDDKLRKHLFEGVKKFSRTYKSQKSKWLAFSKHLFYLDGDFEKQATYVAIRKRCEDFEKVIKGKADKIFYLATPPSLFGVIPKFLHNAGLSRVEELSRLVVEKPFGYDLATAIKLNQEISKSFQESQVFRIDHYLGKETVQNILAFRFANPLFEPIWNRRYVSYIAITVAEEVGVENRGSYYDHAGALRDMVQNHLMQLLCFIAMEPMVSFSAEEIRNKKIDVLHAIRPIDRDKIYQTAVRGQYSEGWEQGKKVKGYRQEKGVDPDSMTETYVALKLYVDNWRWQDVPFYLRTGKRMHRKASEIVIQFQPVPHQPFPPEATLDWKPSRLILRIQPEEGITLRFQAKYPGSQMHLKTVNMKFNYESAFATPAAEAYETLLWDIIQNDQTLFMRADQIEASWKLLTPILDLWRDSPPSDFPNYEAGSWGPAGSFALLAQEKHTWPLPLTAEDL